MGLPSLRRGHSRTVGSGRTGGTNTWRAAGLKAAVPTVIGGRDQGAVAIWLARWLFYRLFPDPRS
ncbi:MAG: glycerol-3-phosphate acyltransferase [Caldilineaceae bacterium]